MNSNSIRHIDFKSRGKGLTFREKRRFPFLRLLLIIFFIGAAFGGYTLFIHNPSQPESSIQPISNASAATGHQNSSVSNSIDIPEAESAKHEAEAESAQHEAESSPEPNRVNLSIPTDAPAPSGIETINDAAKLPDQSGAAIPSRQSNGARKVSTDQFSLVTNETDIVSEALPAKSYKVKKGDSLAAIFQRAGASQRDLILALKVEHAKYLKKIFPGNTLEIQITHDGKLAQLTRKIDYARTLTVTRTGRDSFKSELFERELERRIEYISGTINSSLYVSAHKAGMSDQLIMELVSIFGWNIDFTLDLRKGDSFSLTHEAFYLDNRKIKNGHILAAEFNNRNNFHQAVRYTDPEGETDYFTPDGNSVRKAFIRKPLNYRRVSSQFSRGRVHPLLGVRRPHLGVDFAAKVGTPIKAAGDGKVIYKGRKGGYGRTVIIKHGSIYTTLYGHMSRFGRGISQGKRVKQGQIIGYVGNSGLSTGPHLHYEFRVNGIHKNPLTVKFPTALPIDKKHKKDFLAKTQPMIAELESHQKTMIASSDSQVSPTN